MTGWNLGRAGGSLQEAAAGLELIDPRSWHYRRLTGGRLRYRLVAGRDVTLAAVARSLGYAYLGDGMKERLASWTLRTGKLTRAGASPTAQLLLGDSAPLAMGDH